MIRKKANMLLRFKLPPFDKIAYYFYLISGFRSIGVNPNAAILGRITRNNPIRIGPNRSDNLNASAAAITDGHLLSFDNDRNVAFPGRGFKHGIHILRVLLDIHVFMVLMGRPGRQIGR